MGIRPASRWSAARSHPSLTVGRATWGMSRFQMLASPSVGCIVGAFCTGYCWQDTHPPTIPLGPTPKRRSRNDIPWNATNDPIGIEESRGPASRR